MSNCLNFCMSIIIHFLNHFARAIQKKKRKKSFHPIQIIKNQFDWKKPSFSKNSVRAICFWKQKRVSIENSIVSPSRTAMQIFLFSNKKEGHLFPDTLVFCMNKFAYSGFASESSSAGAAASNVVATVVVAPPAAPAPVFFCIAFASRQSFQSGSELPPKWMPSEV